MEEMKASQNETLARMERMMNADQTDVKLKQLTETVETTHRECEEPTSADMKVCHEATEADIEKTESDSGMMQSVAVHQEVSREDAAVMPVGGLRKHRTGRK
jgi:hypothetical protein